MTGPASALEIGDQIDSYRIEAPVSRSRTATVYRATDLRNGGTVALKVPDPNLAHVPPGGSLWTFKLFEN